MPPSSTKSGGIAMNQYFSFGKNLRLLQTVYSTDVVEYGDITLDYYSVNEWSNNVEFTLIKSIKVNKIFPLQGGFLANDILVLACGTGGTYPARIVFLDMISGEYVKIMELKKCYGFPNIEIQGVSVYRGVIYISSVKGLYVLGQ